MKPIKIDLDRKLKKAKIIVLADTHIGDKHFDLKLLKETIEDVKNDDEMFVILNGDIINNTIKSSVSDVYSEKLTPNEQLDLAVELFMLIKDKILCVNTGNHEQRTWRESGIDISELLAFKLGVEHLYSNEGAVLFVRLGSEKRGRKETNGSGKTRRILYTIYATHGGRGGRKVGGKMNALIELQDVVMGADIYITSHNHSKMTHWGNRNVLDTRNSTVYSSPILFVSNGSYLNYGGYAEIKNYTPQAKGSPVIILDGKKKFFDVIGNYDTIRRLK